MEEEEECGMSTRKGEGRGYCIGGAGEERSMRGRMREDKREEGTKGKRYGSVKTLGRHRASA